MLFGYSMGFKRTGSKMKEDSVFQTIIIDISPDQFPYCTGLVLCKRFRRQCYSLIIPISKRITFYVYFLSKVKPYDCIYIKPKKLVVYQFTSEMQPRQLSFFSCLKGEFAPRKYFKISMIHYDEFTLWSL